MSQSEKGRQVPSGEIGQNFKLVGDLPLERDGPAVICEAPICRKNVDIKQDSGCISETYSASQPNCKLVLEINTDSKSTSEVNVSAAAHLGVYIDGKLKGQGFTAPLSILLDCGSSKSLLSRDVYDRLPDGCRPPLQGIEHHVKFADGSIQHCLGTVRIPVAIGKERSTVDFVVGQFSDKAILGMTELQSLGLTLDFRSLKLTQGDVDM